MKKSLAAAATGATGLSDPTLSYNLDYLSDYAVGMPLLDLMKMSRDWLTHPSGTDLSSMSDLFDQDGWPTEIPDGLNKFTKIWDWTSQPLAEDSRKGVYELSYNGEGTIVVRGAGVNVLSKEDGKIVFEITDTNSLIVDVTETDPNGTGDHLRDISIVREEYVDLHEAGAVFNPEWMGIVDDARELRLILWMETNKIDRDAETLEWEDRPQISDSSWATAGVPVEILVQLANEAGIDPYFTINHNWSDDYIREFATYVRDNLDPKLKAKFEWSNEVWNGLFQQHHYVAEKAEEEWGERDVYGYYTKLAVNMAQILDEVYANSPDAQMVKVLGGFTPNTWISERMLNGSLWAEHEPDQAIGAAEVFDELAVAHYFGSQALRFDDKRAELLSAIEDPEVDANAWFKDQLQDPSLAGSIPDVLDQLAAQKAIADKYGVDLTLYEGGQHVHHQFGIADVNNTLSDFLAQFVRGEEMAELYQQLWDGWSEIGDGAFMNFAATGGISKWGSWGVYASLDDSTPRAEMIEQLNAETASWWGEDREYGTFQQGVFREGTQWKDQLTGTREEDYLIAGDGDDLLIGGAGDDGLHGGAGYDVALLNGTVDDYRIEAEGAGYRLTGLDGSDFLIEVEALQFADGSRSAIADLVDVPAPKGLATPPGTAKARKDQPSTGETILGTQADDVLTGSGGDDTVYDGAGRDGLAGGAGADVFVLAADGDYDWVNDFTLGEDSLDLTAWGVDSFDQLDILQHSAGKAVIKYGSEVLTVNDGFWSLQASAFTADSFIGLNDSPLAGLRVSGTSAHERLSGNSGDDILTDGGGKDGLYGRSGADTFVLVADGNADWIEDFEIGRDVLDLSAWGVESFSDLEIIQHSAGKAVIRFGSEVLTINDGAWTMDASALTVDSFVNLATDTTPTVTLSGTDADDVLEGSEVNDKIIDGAGRDGLYGKAGADTFVLVADGDYDWVKDFELGTDVLDIRAWGASGMSDLEIAQHARGKAIISFQNEVLTVNDGTWTLNVADFTDRDFLF